MRKYLGLGLVLSLLFFNMNTALPHGDEKHEQHDKNGQTESLQGHIIGMTCYLKHEAKGEKHRDCAIDCAKKGLPLGLLTQDGTIYQIMGKGHDDLKSVNEKLLSYIEYDVIAQGETFEKGGVHALVIEKIKKK